MITIGARDSKLSRIQTGHVISELKKIIPSLPSPIFLKSKGDLNTTTPIHLLNEDGLFTSFLEQALIEKQVDLVVHSLKDLPTTPHPDLEILPVMKREDPRDVLIIHEDSLIKEPQNPPTIPQLKEHTRIATSSLRRQAQIKQAFPNTITLDLRGNIDTRLKKLKNNWFDALILSKAGLNRYDLKIPPEYKLIHLPLQEFPTAPGQGSLAVQYRKNDTHTKQLVQALVHQPSKQNVELERSLLQALGSGCMIPLGITVYQENNTNILSYFHAPPSLPPIKLLFTYNDFQSLKDQAITLINQEKQRYMQTPIPSPSPDSPIHDHYVITTKPDEDPMIQALLKQGLQVISLPQYAYTPIPVEASLSEINKAIQSSNWVIFTSKRGVWYYPRDLYPSIIKKKIAVIGETTAKHAKQHGIPVHYISRHQTGQSLATELMSIDSSITGIVHFTSTTPSPFLQQVFEQHGIPFYQFHVYHPTPIEYSLTPSIIPKKNLWVIAFSSQQAQHLLQTITLPPKTKWIAIGPKTAATLQEHNVSPIYVPSSPSVTSILEVIHDVQKN